MKLHDLQVGQRFTFTDKHRGKVFEVTAKTSPNASRQGIHYKDVATGEVRDAWSHREMFRKEVVLEQPEECFTPEEKKLLDAVFSAAYLYTESASVRSDIDKLYLKITGLPGRRVVLPEE